MGILQNLTPEELRLAEAWLKELGEPDRINVEYSAQSLIDWIHGKFGVGLYGADTDLYLDRQFYVLKAIGSTVHNTHGRKPEDVDLLLITNQYINTRHESTPSVRGLISALGRQHELVIDDKIKEEYAQHGEEGVKIGLKSRNPGVKTVDLTFKYDIISEERWNYNDRDPAVVLFRFGHYNANDELFYSDGEWIELRMTHFVKGDSY